MTKDEKVATLVMGGYSIDEALIIVERLDKEAKEKAEIKVD